MCRIIQSQAQSIVKAIDLGTALLKLVAFYFKRRRKMAHGNEYNKKKYYWMKLDRHYFKNARIKKLRKLAGGDTLTIIYLELCLLSIDNDCCLVYEGIENTLEEELALKIDEDVENIKLCMAYLRNQGMIVECEDNDIQLLNLNVGSETQANVYKKEQKIKLGYKNSNQILTPSNQILTEKEIEKDKEKELEIELELNKEKKRETKSDEKEILNYVQNQFKRILNVNDIMIICDWTKKYDTDFIKKCVDYCTSNNKLSTKYCDSVLYNQYLKLNKKVEDKKGVNYLEQEEINEDDYVEVKSNEDVDEKLVNELKSLIGE